MDDPIDPNTIAYLINAVYFKAGWTEVFDPELTREAPFHRLDGRTETVELMIRDDNPPASLHRTLRRRGPALRRRGLLHDGGGPRRGGGGPRAGPGDGRRGVGRTHRKLPDPARADLAPPLRAGVGRGAGRHPHRHGMGPAFQPGADFTRIFENAAPWIDEVKQKTFGRVDEEGTEAAAVTSVAMPTSMPPQVRADRPLLLAIRERLSGTILFVGVILEPPRL